jgi:dihydrolipoamide dehydrogenase
MVVGEMADAVDLLVIGGGPGGYAAALYAAQLGRAVVLVDADGLDGLGGTCVRVGCIPSKALIELANATQSLTRWAGTGLRTGQATVDLGDFQHWKTGIVRGLNGGLRTMFAKRRIEVIAGVARLNRANQVAVATPDGNVRFLEFRDAVVATGSRPRASTTLAVDGDRILDSTGALALATVPKTMAVVGSGYIGIELGIAYAKLGVAVTLVEACERILPQLDGAVSAPVKRRCAELGITVLTSAEIADVGDDDVEVATDGERRRFPAEKIVVAIGRDPATDALGLASAGVRVTDSGHVVTDEFTVAAPHIAAIGDISAGPALAHKAMAEAEAAVRTLSGTRSRFAPLAIPSVIFADPEIAMIGLTESEAVALGMDVVVGQFPLAASGRAATLAADRGFVRVVIDRGADAVVGVQMVGAHVSELCGEAALAIEMSVSPDDLAAVIHPHPTISEALSEAAAIAIGRPLHVQRG